jgi:acetylornithine/N-succinyldiaminopimelate aminotransferase
MDIREMDQTYVANTYGRFDLMLQEGKGSILKDDAGKSYIDLGTGIAVNIYGVADEIWQKAVMEQITRLPHASNLYYTAPQAELAKLLCEKTGMKKVFFGNSGAEANECAIKVARKYAYDMKGEESPVIVTLNNSFHGRTVTTLSATGQESFHKYFGPFTQGFVHADPDDFSKMEAACDNPHVCAVMLELVQGEGGIHVLNKDYVQKVAALCREKGLLLMVDEVQTGNGRTGELYAYMHYGISPDVVSTAKGLGGGLPIGACMMNEKTAGVLTSGTHGSTFGGNPICAAGAVSIVKRLDDALLNGVREKSNYIVETLKNAPGVKSISGLGLMLGIETDKPNKEVVAACQAKGVLTLTAKQKVRLLPALNIPMDLLIQGIEILKEAVQP